MVPRGDAMEAVTAAATITVQPQLMRAHGAIHTARTLRAPHRNPALAELITAKSEQGWSHHQRCANRLNPPRFTYRARWRLEGQDPGWMMRQVVVAWATSLSFSS